MIKTQKMKTAFSLLFLLTLCISATAQIKNFKMGANASWDVHNLSDETPFHFGTEFGYDRKMLKHWSACISAIFQLGQFEQQHTGGEPFTTTDYMIGGQPEIRFFPQGFGNKFYFGWGAQVKLLTALGYDEPTLEEQRPVLQAVERSLVASVGYVHNYQKSPMPLNPFLDVYFDPSDANEYIGGVRLGINFLFGKVGK